MGMCLDLDDVAATSEVAQQELAALRQCVDVLETTAGNLRSLIAACNCNTYDMWLDAVESAIAKATGA